MSEGLRAPRNIYATGLSIGCWLLGACSSSPSVIERRFERTAVQLQHQSDADSLAAAALILESTDGAQALALLARAQEAAPARAELIWLRLQVCQRQSACDPRPDERRLRTVDPTNGAGWFGDLTRAVTANDEAGADAALAAIARTERVDIYWTTLIARLSTAAARTGKVSLDESMIIVVGMLSAMVIPAHGPALKPCKRDRPLGDDMRAVCRGVANAFENGDTAITEMVGVAMAKNVWPEDSAEYQAAVERRRVYKYRSALQPVVWGAAQSRQHVELCREYPREQRVLLEEVIAAGKDPNPPPDFSDR